MKHNKEEDASPTMPTIDPERFHPQPLFSSAAFRPGLSIGLGIATTTLAILGLGAWAHASMVPSSRLFGQALIAPRAPGQIALTFDDGPNPRSTPLLLQILARHNVRATFFMIGQYAAAQPNLVREIHEAGHLIGNHTWTHPNLAITGPTQTREQLHRTSSTIEQILGAPIRYFRPPYGGRNPSTFRIARELGLTPVLWNAMTADWSATTPEAVTPNLIHLIGKNQHRGYASNIVLHDGGQENPQTDRSASIAAAGQLLDHFAAKHHLVTLDAWTAQPA